MTFDPALADILDQWGAHVLEEAAKIVEDGLVDEDHAIPANAALLRAAAAIREAALNELKAPRS